MEIFTGDMMAALNPSGGIMNTIFGVATAFLTAIPNTILDVLSFVFGDNLINPVKQYFDIFVAYMNMAIKHFLAKGIGSISDVLKWILPNDSKLIKFLDNTKNSLEDSATENAAAVGKMMEDKNATLDSISKENKAKAAEANKEGKKAVDQANAVAKQFNNVMYGLPAATTLIQDAKTLVGINTKKTEGEQPATATPTVQNKTIQATPEVQRPPQVAPEQINKQQSEISSTESVTGEKEVSSLTSPEVIGILQSMLAVLQQNLMTDQEQLRLTGELVGQSSKVKADFSSASLMADRILGPRSI